MGELHLDIKVDILAAPTRSTPISARRRSRIREKITKRPRSTTPTRSRPAVPGQFARVKLVVEPNEPGKGFEFESKIVGGAVPKEYIPGVEKGLDSVMGAGVVAGFPVVDVKVELIDGAYSTTSTRRRSPSKSLRAQASAKRCRRASRSCSSRS
jgi:elongation factor G